MLIDINNKKLMMPINHCVYRFISPSGKSYIGISTNLYKRYLDHKRNYKNKKSKFYDACKSYGFENFKLEVLHKDMTNRCCLNALEKIYIETFNSLNEGYNMTIGGDGNVLHGELNGMFGRKHTEESKAKMSKNAKPMFGHTYNKDRIMVYDDSGKVYKVFKDDERFLNGELKIKEPKKRKLKTEEEIIESRKIGVLKRLETFSNKSKEEIDEINKKKARPKELNGRSTFYHLISPSGDEFLVSLFEGLEKFCSDNNLLSTVFFKYRNKDLIPEPSKHDTNMYNDDYKIRRLNSVGWKVNHLRRIKI